MTSHQEVAIETTAAAIGSKATYTGAGMTLSGWLLSSEFAVLAGLVLGVAGFLVNWYYKYKADKRMQREHDARMGLY